MRAILDTLFPPQCGGCESIGSGFCFACASTATRGARHLTTLSVSAFGGFEGALARAVRAVKDGRRDVAAALGAHLQAVVPPESVLVPVTTTTAMRRVRGFDGVAYMADIAAGHSARVLNVLRRTASDSQRGRSRPERLAAKGRFAVDGEGIAGLRLTLFDDVCTTGATLEDCAGALRASGATVEKAIVAALA